MKQEERDAAHKLGYGVADSFDRTTAVQRVVFQPRNRFDIKLGRIFYLISGHVRYQIQTNRGFDFSALLRESIGDPVSKRHTAIHAQTRQVCERLHAFLHVDYGDINLFACASTLQVEWKWRRQGYSILVVSSSRS